jgi:FlaA1/EpsC-like NDP-sugar epimerase
MDQKNNKVALVVLRHRAWFIAVFQVFLVSCSLVCAWLLRFDLALPDRHMLLLAMPLLVVVRIGAMFYFGLFHGWWKYAGVSDGVAVLKAVGTGSLFFFVTLHYALGAKSFPRTIYILEPLLTAVFLIGIRLLTRILAESAREDIAQCKRVMIIGAGSAAQTILRELERPGCGYAVIGCLDDDSSKTGIRIQNVPVLGAVDQLPTVLRRQPIDEVLIAVPSATSTEMCRFVEICNQAGIKFRTVPALKDIIAGEVTVSQLREVDLEDLLGRDPVRIDLESVNRQVTDRTVLVTGAAGSIGSELCRQILSCGSSRLVCLDQNETGLFYLRLELEKRHHGARLDFRVADVTDSERIQGLLIELRPDIIFHAAAYKHVPLMESNVQEAVKNNVLGLMRLLDVAEEAGCRSFVLISSDKAVNPTNIMGATKRIGELILSSRPPNGMRCVSVRFGNVLGSNGSVIPVLKQQLRDHEPLTITHSEIKRFFMTIHEAVALVLQGFAIGQHGDILVLDMGEPVRIVDLARTLIRLSGKSEQDVEIRFTGLREGEKLKEELFYDQEEVIATSCEKIKRTCGTTRDWTLLCRHLEELRVSMSVDGAAPVRCKIKEIVPEYSFEATSWDLEQGRAVKEGAGEWRGGIINLTILDQNGSS